MGMLNDKVIGQAKEVLKDMKAHLSFTYFSQEHECEPCTSVSAFVEELPALDERLGVEKKDFVGEGELARKMGIHHIPALVLHRPDDGRPAVRYYGLPAGYEFGAFLRTLVLFSTGRMPETFNPEEVAGIDRDLNLKVFVLVTCPSCPAMAFLACALAYASPRITTEIIEANNFVDLSTRFNVGTVPKIVINDTHEVLGVISPDEMVQKIKEL